MKIIQILKKIVIGLVCFYLVFSILILPLGLWWGIQNQGTKILKHPVRVRTVWFNPFLYQLTINGFEILDNHNKLMIGFDRMFVDVSFVNLFKKIYMVESFKLTGLKVNVALQEGGKINLLELIPQDLTAGKASTSAQQKTSSQTAPPSTSLPQIIADKISLEGGQIYFTDQTITPRFQTSLSALQLQIDHVSTNPADFTKISFQTNLDEKGKIASEVQLKPLAVPIQLEANTTINDYVLTILSPYIGKYTGRALSDGRFNFRMDYRISDNKLTASHKILIQKFEFGQKVESKDALPLPFGLAVALLEDPQGKINISLPVSGDLSDPKFEYFHLIGQVARNFFMKLVTKPFSFLASVIGGSEDGTDELGYVRFAPGKADLSDEEKNKLLKLVQGLKERPKLKLEINGSYDPQVDWKAIQLEVFTKDYEQLRKDSTRSESKVYQQLYQRRFGIRALWALAKKYKEGIEKYEEQKLDQEIKRQLIEHAPADVGALGILAQARAKLIEEFFLTAGFDANRLSLGQPHAVQSSMGYIPLEFTLTVLDEKSSS